jgi:type VI protein secretion system component VasK
MRAQALTSGKLGHRDAASGRIGARIVLALALVALAAYWIWSLQSERRAIRNLPPAERAALYERTLADVTKVCASSDASLDAYCQEQARVLLSLPECDGACRELALRQVGSARRAR